LVGLRAIARVGDEHDLAAELPAPFVEVALPLHRRDDDLGTKGAGCRRRPRDGDRAQRQHARRDHARLDALDRPAAAELEAFGVHVRESERAELLLRPLLGRAHLRRVRHAAADAIGEVRGRRRDLAVVERFVDDAIDHRMIDLCLDGGRECRR
jgi:ethanolamine ammonia-lyase small subunit